MMRNENNWEMIKKIAICPDCKGERLKISEKIIKCPECKNSYPILEGIPILVKSSDQKKILDIWNEKKEFEDYELKMTPRVKNFLGRLSKYGLSLDCGCGSGAYTNFFKKSVVSIDTFPYFIKKTRKNSKNQSNVFIIADARNLPFKKNSFKLCFSSSVLEHFPKKESDNIIKSFF